MRLLIASAFLACAAPAVAQVTGGPQEVSSGSQYVRGGPQQAGTPEAAPTPSDPGRYVPNDRDGLAGRGGSNPTGSGNSYSATIGSTIFSTIGTPIGSAMGVPR